MASTPEGKVKKRVKQLLDAVGAYHFSPMTGGYGKSGVPDIIALHKGVMYGIETKAGTNQPTALQTKNLNLISKNGGVALVINELNAHVLEKLLAL